MLKKHIKGLLNKGLNKKELESESIAHNIDYKLYEVANPDVYKAVRRRKFPNSASHFDKFGMQEVRTGKRLLYKGFPPFDETTYIKHNADVAEAVENGVFVDGFEHFVNHGNKEMLSGQRRITPNFEFNFDASFIKHFCKFIDLDEYSKTDSALVGLNQKDVRDDFCSKGIHRVFSGEVSLYPRLGLYSEAEYLFANPDVLNAVVNGNTISGFAHFLQFGANEILKGARKLDNLGFQYYYRAPVFNDLIKKRITEFSYKPKISVVMPVYNVDPKWLRLAIRSLERQWYDNWELCICDDASTNQETLDYLRELEQNEKIHIYFSKENGNISNASNKALKLASGDYIALMDNDDELTDDAFYEVVKALQLKNYDFIYSDEDKIEMDGRFVEPHFKPDFNPEMFLSHNYLSHLGVIKKALVDKVDGWREGVEGAQDYDLYLRVLELTQSILHIPKVLYHWRKIPGSTASEFGEKSYAQDAGKISLEDAMERRGTSAIVENGITPGTYRVRNTINGKPLISIIIPFRDRPELLKQCIESLFEFNTYENIEILGVNNNSTCKETLALMAKLKAEYGVRFIDYPGVFNYSAINNFAVSHSNGDYLLFLNNDIEFFEQQWLEALLEQAQKPHVGAVGGKLLYPDNTIQHAGLVLAPKTGHAVINVFKGLPSEANGYFARAQCISNFSAVTAALLLIEKSKFQEVSGFNEERLAVAYNDVDLCLKLLKKGYKNVYTPFSQAYHHESASRGLDIELEKLKRQRSELTAFRDLNPEFLSLNKVDACYSPNLSQFSERFDLHGLNTTEFGDYVEQEFYENILFQKQFADFSGKPVCIFSHFDKSNEVAEYVVYYLQALNKVFDIVFVSTATLSASSVEEIASLVNTAIVKENIGYDFGAWKTGLGYLESVGVDYDNLLLCNDSVYGPFGEVVDIIDKASKSGADVYAISDSYEITYHLQSYFMFFNKKALKSSAWYNFWNDYKIIKNKHELILRNEIGISQQLCAEGLNLKAMVPASTLGHINNMHFNWKQALLDYDAGFIKIELLRDNPLNIQISDWESVASKLGYPVQLANKHLMKNSLES